MPTPCPQPWPLSRKRTPDPAGATYGAADERAACGAAASVTAAARTDRAASRRARTSLRVASGPSGRSVDFGPHCEATEPRLTTQGWRPGLFAFLGGRMGYVESRDRATSNPETRREVLAEVESRGIEDVLLWFTDLEGHLKS